jgi:hypothetical protein
MTATTAIDKSTQMPRQNRASERFGFVVMEWAVYFRFVAMSMTTPVITVDPDEDAVSVAAAALLLA